MRVQRWVWGGGVDVGKRPLRIWERRQWMTNSPSHEQSHRRPAAKVGRDAAPGLVAIMDADKARRKKAKGAECGGHQRPERRDEGVPGKSSLGSPTKTCASFS
jgi:hypothetical protein